MAAQEYGLPFPGSFVSQGALDPENKEQRQREIATDILGFTSDQLNKVEQPVQPRRAGAGRVSTYNSQPVHERPLNPDPIATEIAPAVLAPELRGYPQLARFLSSDKSFFIFQRFDELAARNLLYMQDELSSLGEKLSALDRAELTRRTPLDLYNLHSNRKDKNQQRKTLMREIRELLKEYQQALCSQSSVLTLESPPEDELESLRNWVDAYKPTSKEESHFLSDSEDLCSLSSNNKEKDALQRFIERRFAKHFITDKHRRKTEAWQDGNMFFYSSTSIKRFVRLIVTLTILAFLVAPVFLFYFVENKATNLSMLVVFSVGFAVALALGTKSRNIEIFAVLAGYLAILVAFLSSKPT